PRQLFEPGISRPARSHRERPAGSPALPLVSTDSHSLAGRQRTRSSPDATAGQPRLAAAVLGRRPADDPAPGPALCPGYPRRVDLASHAGLSGKTVHLRPVLLPRSAGSRDTLAQAPREYSAALAACRHRSGRGPVVLSLRVHRRSGVARSLPGRSAPEPA